MIIYILLASVFVYGHIHNSDQVCSSIISVILEYHNINELQHMLPTSNQIKLFSQTHKLNSHEVASFSPQKTPSSMEVAVLHPDAASIDRCLEILEWRFKTYLPIIKPIHFALNTSQQLSPLKQQKLVNRSPEQFQKMSPNKKEKAMERANSEERERVDSTYEVMVQIEGIKYLLCDIKLLSFPQVIYLLKEMMIGYEVLVDVFGIFDPNDSMIAINDDDQWKLWVNSNFTLNAEVAPNISQKEFIYKLIIIAESHCLQTTISRKFFLEVKEITYAQQCSFVKVLQKVKDFSIANKVYPVHKVVMPRENLEKQENKTLKKMKGFHRIEQLKSSLIDGKFVPKQVWTFRTQKNDHSNCSFSQNEDSPVKKVISMRSNQRSNAEDTKNNLISFDWITQTQFHQYFTPRQKLNPKDAQLYSPQITGESKISPVRPHKSALNPRLNFTISNSLIQKRRRSDQTKYCSNTIKLQVVSDEINEQNEDIQCHLKRQNAVKNLSEVLKKEAEDPKKELMNSYNNSSSTQLKESDHAEKSPTAYKNLKKNDFQQCAKPRNNQSSFVNITIPSYQHKDSKNLSISYEFKTKKQQNQKESEQEEIQQHISSQWKNTISGLFSDTTTIRQLKTSIKIKTPNEKAEQRRYASNINLQVLSKMGRDADDSLDDENQDDAEEMANLQLTQKSKIWKCMKDSQQEAILKRPQRSTKTIPDIVISCPKIIN